MNERAKNVADYYVMTNKLKSIVRKGWTTWNVSKERVESVAEHIFGVEQLAIAVWSEYGLDLDIKKILMMLAIHETEEVLIGDLAWYEITEDEKMQKGHEAIEKVLEPLAKKEELKELILEFDERKSPEAIFAYHCDKMECDFQARLYDLEGFVDKDDQKNNDAIHSEKVRELFKKGLSFSEMWLEFDRSKFEGSDEFLELLEYIKTNDIRK